MSFWDGVDFFSMITLMNKTDFENYTITKNIDGTVSLLINYASDIHGMEMTLVIDPAKSGKP